MRESDPSGLLAPHCWTRRARVRLSIFMRGGGGRKRSKTQTSPVARTRTRDRPPPPSTGRLVSRDIPEPIGSTGFFFFPSRFSTVVCSDGKRTSGAFAVRRVTPLWSSASCLGRTCRARHGFYADRR